MTVRELIEELEEFGGDMESMQTSFSALAMALLLGILLVYMVMAAQFESLSQPFVIIFTIPLAIIGVILSRLRTLITHPFMSFNLEFPLFEVYKPSAVVSSLLGSSISS